MTRTDTAARKLHDLREDMLSEIDGSPECEQSDAMISFWINELDDALRALGPSRVCPFSDPAYKQPEDAPCPVCGIRGDALPADIDKACREAREGKEKAA